MRYIVITTDPASGEQSAFFTDWFMIENHYNPDYKMIVIDRKDRLITFDGEIWNDIEQDNL